MRQAAEEESSLASLSSRLYGKVSQNEVAEKALESIVEFLNASMGTIFLLEGESQLVRRAAYALPARHGIINRIFIGERECGPGSSVP